MSNRSIRCIVTIHLDIELIEGEEKPRNGENCMKTSGRGVDVKRTHKRNGRIRTQKMTAAERAFQKYMGQRSVSYGRLADRMKADRRPRLAGAETLTSFA